MQNLLVQRIEARLVDPARRSEAEAADRKNGLREQFQRVRRTRALGHAARAIVVPNDPLPHPVGADLAKDRPDREAPSRR